MLRKLFSMFIIGVMLAIMVCTVHAESSEGFKTSDHLSDFRANHRGPGRAEDFLQYLLDQGHNVTVTVEYYRHDNQNQYHSQEQNEHRDRFIKVNEITAINEIPVMPASEDDVRVICFGPVFHSETTIDRKTNVYGNIASSALITVIGHYSHPLLNFVYAVASKFSNPPVIGDNVVSVTVNIIYDTVDYYEVYRPDLGYWYPYVVTQYRHVNTSYVETIGPADGGPQETVANDYYKLKEHLSQNYGYDDLNREEAWWRYLMGLNTLYHTWWGTGSREVENLWKLPSSPVPVD